METISEMHEKIFKFLMEKRKQNSNLYFMPRIKNNKKRLEKCYWFLGDENYIIVTFWSDKDKLNMTGNILFGVFTSKSQDKRLKEFNSNSFIELVVRDNDKEKLFIRDKIISKIPNFKEYYKNKWSKLYFSKNYIENLEEFLNIDKPIIDNIIISKENNSEIKLLTQNDTLKYINKINNMRKINYDK